MIKVGLYVRVSTSKQEAMNQLIQLREYSEKSNYEIFNEYSTDELRYHYDDTDLTTILNNNDESSMIKGKIVVDTDKLEVEEAVIVIVEFIKKKYIK